MAERKTTAEFIRPDGTSSGRVEIHVTETTDRTIQGLTDTYGWTEEVSWTWAAPILVGDRECELVYDGKRIPVLVDGKLVNEDLLLRFQRSR